MPLKVRINLTGSREKFKKFLRERTTDGKLRLKLKFKNFPKSKSFFNPRKSKVA